MPPKAAHESSGVKPEMSNMTNHRKAATQIHFSRVAGFLPREMSPRLTHSLYNWGLPNEM